MATADFFANLRTGVTEFVSMVDGAACFGARIWCATANAVGNRVANVAMGTIIQERCNAGREYINDAYQEYLLQGDDLNRVQRFTMITAVVIAGFAVANLWRGSLDFYSKGIYEMGKGYVWTLGQGAAAAAVFCLGAHLTQDKVVAALEKKPGGSALVAAGHFVSRIADVPVLGACLQRLGTIEKNIWTRVTDI